MTRPQAEQAANAERATRPVHGRTMTARLRITRGARPPSRILGGIHHVKRQTALLSVLAIACGVALGYAVATGRLIPTQAASADEKSDDKAPPYKLDRT